MSSNDQELTTFRESIRTCHRKASDKAKCGEAQARVAKQSRSSASEPTVRRSGFIKQAY